MTAIKRHKQRLLVSVRGPREALEAAKGGAHIADVEYPASALGTPYPLNILTVRNRLNKAGFKRVAVSTNIGEVQANRATSCQAALGVAVSGADLIKFGLANHTLDAAVYLARNLIKTVHKLGPKLKKLYPAVFIDVEMCRFFKPFDESTILAKESNADGILIDTFNKLIGKGLLDYCTIDQIGAFVEAMHSLKKEAWIAGSISLDQLPGLWATGVDVICVRGAACASRTGSERFGEVKAAKVRELVATLGW